MVQMRTLQAQEACTLVVTEEREPPAQGQMAHKHSEQVRRTTGLHRTGYTRVVVQVRKARRSSAVAA